MLKYWKITRKFKTRTEAMACEKQWAKSLK